MGLRLTEEEVRFAIRTSCKSVTRIEGNRERRGKKVWGGWRGRGLGQQNGRRFELSVNFFTCVVDDDKTVGESEPKACKQQQRPGHNKFTESFSQQLGVQAIEQRGGA